MVLWVRSGNVGDDYKEMPSLDLTLLQDGIEIGKDADGNPRRCSDEGHGNACYPGLWPGVSCEGWKVWAVPEATQVEGLVAETWFHYWSRTSVTARWYLEP